MKELTHAPRYSDIHALRATEYADRNLQYQWLLDALKLRQAYVWDFSRLTLIRQFLSKQKVNKLVDNGTVWVWGAPRMPTIRGVYRGSMTIPALWDYILKQVISRSVTFQDRKSFWPMNKKSIGPIAHDTLLWRLRMLLSIKTQRN